MKFAICNETFKEWPFDKAFAYARELGYTGIELAPFTIENDVRDISDQRRQQVKSQAESAGLEVIGLHWLLAFTEDLYLTTADQRVRKQTSSYLSDLARFCRDVGGKVMVLGSPQQRNLLPGVTLDQAMNYAADVIHNALPTIEDCGVTLALEPLGRNEGNFLVTMADGVELMQMIDSPSVRLHLDVKAMSSESKPISEVIRTHASHMVHFHANDPNLRGPGMGDVDFIPILKALQDVDYQGWISVEVFDYSPGVEALASQSIRYMQECIEKI